MTFYQRHRNAFLITGALVLVFLVISMNLGETKGFNLLERVGVEIVAPLQKGILKLLNGVTGVWSDYFYLVGAWEENKKLNKLVLTLEEKNRAYGEVVLANIRLRKLLNLQSQLQAHPTRAAEVVGRDPSQWFSTLTINKGSKDGLRHGMPVVVPRGVVGRVVSLSRNYAQVLLVPDPQFAVDATDTRSRIRGVFAGSFRGGCQFKYIQRNEDVRVGDELVTSGLGEIFPQGLLLGTVLRISPQGSGLFQDIEAHPAVNFNQIEEVLVILTSKFPED